MVGFGQSIREARRQGWEGAYLDYERLGAIIDQMRMECHNLELKSNGSQSRSIQQYNELSNQFSSKLQQEIEKVSIFSLAKIGDIANAIGALRCMDRKDDGFVENAQLDPESIIRSSSELDEGNGEGFNFDDFGERGSLLPASDKRHYSDLRSSCRSSMIPNDLFSRGKLTSLVGHQIDAECDMEKDMNEVYSELGVELLHLLKFNCLNSVGIRKIVKKREKVEHCFTQVTRLQEHHTGFEVGSSRTIFLPDEVSSRLNNARDDRLHQLANTSSCVALYDSLLEALIDSEARILPSLTIGLPNSDPIIFSKQAAVKFLQESREIENGLSLLRFECTISSIHALVEFAADVHKPFQAWLSRKALIETGKDRGDVGNSGTKALELLLLFEPDFIMQMTESELYEWYRRASAKSERHTRDSTFIDYAVGEDMKGWGGVNTSSLVINLVSTLLYTVNYYIIAPTANHYARLLGTNGAFGATLIGVSSFSAIFAAFLYSIWYSKATFKSGLIFSAICPLVGNLMYSFAISYHSMKLALFGRLLCGFGSAEVINRQLISACVSYHHMTRASALFVSVSAIGMSVGPLIAAILDMTGGRDINIDIRIPLPGASYSGGIVFDHCTDPGFLMAFLWLIQLISLVFFFTEPERINIVVGTDANIPRNGDSIWTSFFSVHQALLGLFDILFSNQAFVVTLFLFSFIELVGEVLISSCSMIVLRYFDWHGSRAGLILASLGGLVLPAHFIVEHASRRFPERVILRASIFFVLCSIFAICNFEGLILDIAGAILNSEDTKHNKELKKLKKEVNEAMVQEEFPYDWGAGVYVYLTSLSAIFIGTIVMEGVNTSLMSKSAPKELDGFFNMGLLATLVGSIGRVVGDSMITFSVFVGSAPLHDFVSVTFLPLVPLIAVGYWLLKRNYNDLLI